MTAKPLPLELSESAEDKASDSKSNSENTLLSSDVTKESCDVKTNKLPIPQEELDDPSSGLTADGSASQRFKKSSFQITRIVKTSEAGDSTDDLDEVTSIEDMGSNVVEKSANANLESNVHSIDTPRSPGSAADVESLSSCQKHLCLKPSHHSSRPRPSDINSRFKIVKIVSNKPLRRGRWMCLEFVDPPHLSVSLEKQTKHNDDTESLVSSCIASPIYYVQVEKEDPSNNPFAAAIIYSNGQPSLEPNPLPLRESAIMSQSSCSNPPDSLALPSVMVQQLQQHDSGIEVMKVTSELSDRVGESTESSGRHPFPSSYLAHQPNSSSSSIYDAGHRAFVNGILFGSDGLGGIGKEEERLVIRTGSEHTLGYSRVSEAVVGSPPLFSIVSSTTNSCPSGLADNDNSGGICALDNKIEQAMDLVKSHLMFAVHEEVELLKEQIKELTIKKGQLEYENTVLRASATQETLEKLHASTLSTGLS